MPKIKCQTSIKVQTLTRLLQDRESISSICEDLKISPVVLGQWSREVIGGLPLVFDKSLKKAERGKERKNDELRQGLHGFIYSNTSPYYPQSNGKLEKFHDSLKNELPVGRELTSFEYAERVIDRLSTTTTICGCIVPLAMSHPVT